MGKNTHAPAEELVEITVDSDNHTHEGRLCSRGDKITVGKTVAAMLEQCWGKEKKAK
jgi:hypothetical protein